MMLQLFLYSLLDDMIFIYKKKKEMQTNAEAPYQIWHTTHLTPGSDSLHSVDDREHCDQYIDHWKDIALILLGSFIGSNTFQCPAHKHTQFHTYIHLEAP